MIRNSSLCSPLRYGYFWINSILVGTFTLCSCTKCFKPWMAGRTVGTSGWFSCLFFRFTGVAPPLCLPHAAGSCNKEHPNCWWPHQTMVGHCRRFRGGSSIQTINLEVVFVQPWGQHQPFLIVIIDFIDQVKLTGQNICFPKLGSKPVNEFALICDGFGDRISISCHDSDNCRENNNDFCLNDFLMFLCKDVKYLHIYFEMQKVQFWKNIRVIYSP